MQFCAKIILFFVALTVYLDTHTLQAAVLTADTVWRGEITLTEDVLVPAGVTLTIAPGTIVNITPAESTKTDPEYLSPLVEITVRGVLNAQAPPQAPIRFGLAQGRRDSAWAGIFIDGGTASLTGCRIESAESAIHLLQGSLQLRDSTLSGNRYGLILQGAGSKVNGAANRITGNDYGLVLFQGAPTGAGLAAATGNRKKDLLSLSQRANPAPLPKIVTAEPAGEARRYRDTVLVGETVWSHRVQVDGTVRVPEGSRLVLLPGTVVEFGFRDTNGDGIGESGILVQGVIVAKGSAAQPIVFRSASRPGRKGSWDAINIMNSDGASNLLEHCRFQDAYRALHFHFSRVAVTDNDFSGNYRGIQFQEASVLLRGNRFQDNTSAVQGRDSEVTLTSNRVERNYQGINFLRCKLQARGNQVLDQIREGMRIREGATLFEENLIDGNRYGLLVADAYYGSFARNSISNNAETGFALKNVDNIEISGNFISGNGMNGLSLQEAGGRISGNLISDNGERGVGVLSFAGVLEQNNLAGNGVFAVELEGAADLAAPRNWWGGGEPAKTVCDKRCDPARGSISQAEPAAAPFPFRWPLPRIETSLTWRGDIAIERTPAVAPGATLTLAAGTRALFAAGTGLEVRGRIVADGTPQAPILFSAQHRDKAGSWDEIIMEHADGSSFRNCIVEYANWGVHSHFSRLAISDSTFRHNNGGLRFRSGPVRISGSLFSDNDIGIRSFRGNAVIEGNTITGNRTGVFVREKGGGLTLRRNNLSANTDYNVRLGDFNDEDVDARENWWGTPAPRDSILDASREPGIGLVRFEPFLREPVRSGLKELK